MVDPAELEGDEMFSGDAAVLVSGGFVTGWDDDFGILGIRTIVVDVSR